MRSVLRDTAGWTFYTLVGAHALHVLAALAWLGIILIPRNPAGVPVFGMYWYFVVGLWPILYTLVYLA